MASYVLRSAISLPAPTATAPATIVGPASVALEPAGVPKPAATPATAPKKFSYKCRGYLSISPNWQFLRQGVDTGAPITAEGPKVGAVQIRVGQGL